MIAVLAASVGGVVLTALVSGAVALLTTLAVEYAAKPNLEARKEKLLERGRAVRGLNEALVRVGQLLAYRNSPDLVDVVPDIPAGHAAVALERLQEALVRIDVPDDMADAWYAAGASVRALVKGLHDGYPCPRTSG